MKTVLGALSVQLGLRTAGGHGGATHMWAAASRGCWRLCRVRSPGPLPTLQAQPCSGRQRCRPRRSLFLLDLGPWRASETPGKAARVLAFLHSCSAGQLWRRGLTLGREHDVYLRLQAISLHRSTHNARERRVSGRCLRCNAPADKVGGTAP